MEPISFDQKSFFDGTSQTAVTQTTWADYWRGVIPDGVVAGIGNEMKTYGWSGGMHVRVASGACFADNHRGVLNSEKELDIDTAHATKPRIDLVVARVVYDNTDSDIVLDVIKGTPATTPTAPDLDQSGNPNYEIKLAEVYVKPQTEEDWQTIKAEQVTDFRNIFQCGEQAFAFTNADSEVLERGMVVALDSSVEGGIKKATSGDMPIGVVRSTYISPGAAGQIDTKPGTVSDIKCGSPEVRPGDALVVGNTAGLAEPGGSPYFAAGLALGSKAANITANVKSLLTIISRIPYQNNWYLADNLTENDVLCAYQFVNRRTASDALVNINTGESYALTLSTDTITWNTETGFTFPASGTPQLQNPLLISNAGSGIMGSIRGAVFGYHIDTTSTNEFCGGIVLSWQKSLMIRGMYMNSSHDKTAIGRPAIYHGSLTIRSTPTNLSPSTYGVIGGSWKANASDGAPQLYIDGDKITNQTTYTYTYPTDAPVTFGGIGQTSGNNVPFNMTCVAFYKKELTDTQQSQLASKISALGGIS